MNFVRKIQLEVVPTGSNRIVAFDIAKGIGILLVVFAHVNYTPAILTYIYSFHMPLFFILSGMLFKRDKYKDFFDFFKRKATALVCPYLFFYIIPLAIKMLCSFVTDGLSGVLTRKYLSFIANIFICPSSGALVNGPLWFLLCLLAIEVMYYFISKMRPVLIASVCGILSCIGWLLESGIVPRESNSFLWCLDTASFSMGFFALGNLLSERAKHILAKAEEHHSKLSYIICTLLFALALIPVAFANGKVSLGSKILNNGILLYLSGIIGTLAVLACAVLFQWSKFLKFLGQNSLAIMSTHYIFYKFFDEFYPKLGLTMYNEENILHTFLPFVLILCTSIACTLLYNRIKTAFLPKLINRWKNHREKKKTNRIPQ